MRGVTIKAVMAARTGVVLVSLSEPKVMCMDRVEGSHHHLCSSASMGGMG